MNPPLIIDGLVERALSLSFEALCAIPETDQVRDVSRFHPTRHGDAIGLSTLLREARPSVDANYVTLHAERDDFHVSVPLAPLLSEGLVVYVRDGRPLGSSDFGPYRFLIRDPSACHTSELDDCANVKFLSRIELTSRKGRDTRPTTEAEHAALHAAETAGEEAHQP